MKITNLKIFKKITNIPVVHLFTKEYQQKVMYYEILRNNIDQIKLASDNYNLDERIEILKGR